MRTFVDTNVFLYAFLDQDQAKKGIAVGQLMSCIRDGEGFVSLQVVKEFCNVMMKRSPKSSDDIIEATHLFDRFNMVDGSLDMVRRALAHKIRYDIQFYDALMIAAAESARCSVILSEDLNAGQVYAGVKAVNPFTGVANL